MRGRRAVAGAVVATVLLLAVIGVASGVARGIYVDDFVQRLEPLRARGYVALGIHDPLANRRAEFVARADERFARYRTATRLHVLGGAIFLLLAPVQMAGRVRRRYPGLHRWSGRLLVVTVVASIIPGLFFGLAVPMAGNWERSVIALAGGFLIFAVLRAYVAIRRRNIALHREWMIRGFAAALAISTVRLVAGGLDIVLTPHAVPFETIFVLALWLGWAVTLGLAELWLRHTRTGAPVGQAIRTGHPAAGRGAEIA
jgi:uncharacterized membrane protein